MQTLKITKKADYAIIQLNRGKANAINQLFLNELRAIIQEFQADDSVRGVIITGQPRFFSAGLDLIEIYDYDKEQMEVFSLAFGQMYLELARFPKPLIAAVTGHAPAGGTVIAQTCDYRVMVDEDKYTIGLNEIAVNVGLSEDLIRGYAFWLGEGLANRYLLQGKLMTGREALAVGFVDEICPMDQVLAQAEAQMQEYLKANTAIFQSIKYKSRKNWLSQLGKNDAAELAEGNAIWWDPTVRARMKAFVDFLAKR